MNKKNNPVLLAITIAVLLIAVVTATYAYLVSTNDNYGNIDINTTLASSNAILKSEGGEIGLAITASNMQEQLKGNLAAENNTTLTVSLLSKSTDGMKCTYDVYYKWEEGTDAYTISKAGTNEFTYAITSNNLTVSETNFIASSGATPQKLNTNSITIIPSGILPTSVLNELKAQLSQEWLFSSSTSNTFGKAQLPYEIKEQ